MAFLDNSGDIILDAVLTDTGRLRLAQGDGSFKITKFALGDDEINYENYNKNHTSGSAYYDLEILQTPVLEAFTNNTSNLNSKLMSIARTNILFMPELLLNLRDHGSSAYQQRDSWMYDRTDTFNNGTAANPDGASGANQPATSVHANYANTRFVVAADPTTWKTLKYHNNSAVDGKIEVQGLIQGFASDDPLGGGLIRVDQGLNTLEINPTAGLDSDLVETQFILELDYRLGRVARPNNNAVTDVNFIDDDNIASYYIAGAPYVYNNTNVKSSEGSDSAQTDEDWQVFNGPRGTSLLFRLRASTELQYSTYLYTQIGKKLTAGESVDQLGIHTKTMEQFAGENAAAYVIDTTVRVVGANTGFRMDIPVRYLKIE